MKTSNKTTQVLNGLKSNVVAVITSILALIFPARDAGSQRRNPRPCRLAKTKKKKLGAVAALALRASVARKVVAGAGIVAAAGAVGACKIHVVDAETPAPTPIPELTPAAQRKAEFDAWTLSDDRNMNIKGETETDLLTLPVRDWPAQDKLDWATAVQARHPESEFIDNTVEQVKEIEKTYDPYMSKATPNVNAGVPGTILGLRQFDALG